MTRSKKPLIFTVLGCIGAAVTAFAAINETRKRLEKLKELEEEETKEESIVEKVSDYKLTLVSLGLTACSMAAANISSAKEFTMLAGTLSYVTAHRKAILDRVKDCFPVEELAEARDEAIKGTFNRMTIEDTGNGDTLCIESYSGRIFRSSREAVEAAMIRYADRYSKGEYVNFDDLYDELEIMHSGFGRDHGYAPGSDFYDETEEFDYEISELSGAAYGGSSISDQMVRDEDRIIVIDIYTTPCECYMEL